MKQTVCYIPLRTPALAHAAQILDQNLCVACTPGPEVSHVLLPVPCSGMDLPEILTALPEGVTLIGGNLPAVDGYQTIDLLRDPFYVAENAAITAHCALKHILNASSVTLAGQNVLVIGWGRIGKCLGRLLRGVDAHVTIVARKETDRAMAAALGFRTVDPVNLSPILPEFRFLINTAPAPVLSENEAALCRPDCLKIDLASVKGIPGEDVVWARGLPGKDAPESSGRLIAKTILRLVSGREYPL